MSSPTWIQLIRLAEYDTINTQLVWLPCGTVALRHCGTVAATDMSGAEGEAEGEAATSELHNEGHLGATVGSDNACHIYTDTATALLHATSEEG